MRELEGHKKVEYFGVAVGWVILVLAIGYTVALAIR